MDRGQAAQPDLQCDEPGVVIIAVVVAYNPDISHLGKLCARLVDQVDHTLIVDNSEGGGEFDFVSGAEPVTITAMGANLGIGAAQNRGIKQAISMGATHVLLLDQDSLPALLMVDTLYSAELELLEKTAGKLAAVGPWAVSAQGGQREPFVALKKNRRQLSGQNRSAESVETVRVKYLHSSGTLIRTAVFHDVGFMDETMFIDMVDMEWCFRAAGRQYACYGVYQAELYHHIGCKQPIGFGRVRRKVSVHPPVRTYYQTRNWLLMTRKRYVPLSWLLRHGARNILFRFLMLVFFMPQRKERCLAFFRGLIHGLKGTGGKCELGI